MARAFPGRPSGPAVPSSQRAAAALPHPGLESQRAAAALPDPGLKSRRATAALPVRDWDLEGQWLPREIFVRDLSGQPWPSETLIGVLGGQPPPREIPLADFDGRPPPSQIFRRKIPGRSGPREMAGRGRRGASALRGGRTYGNVTTTQTSARMSKIFTQAIHTWASQNHESTSELARALPDVELHGPAYHPCGAELRGSAGDCRARPLVRFGHGPTGRRGQGPGDGRDSHRL
jgi:hypothetical protein